MYKAQCKPNIFKHYKIFLLTMLGNDVIVDAKKYDLRLYQ